MNNKLLISALVFSSFALTSVVNAQIMPVGESATVKVSVDLHQVMSISLGTGGNAVPAFVYQTTADYDKDMVREVSNQLQVFSTESYSIMLKADGDFIGQSDNKSRLSLNVLKVSAKFHKEKAEYQTEITPATSSADLLTGGKPTLGDGIDVNYKIPKNPDLWGKEKQVYQANMIYSISSK